MELWRKFSWGKEQQLEHIPIKTSSPLLCWISNNCPFFIPKWVSETFTASASATTIITTAAATTTIKFCQIIWQYELLAVRKVSVIWKHCSFKRQSTGFLKHLEM